MSVHICFWPLLLYVIVNIYFVQHFKHFHVLYYYKYLANLNSSPYITSFMQYITSKLEEFLKDWEHMDLRMSQHSDYPSNSEFLPKWHTLIKLLCSYIQVDHISRWNSNTTVESTLLLSRDYPNMIIILWKIEYEAIFIMRRSKDTQFIEDIYFSR